MLQGNYGGAKKEGLHIVKNVILGYKLPLADALFKNLDVL
jgi:hypothetical protein